MSKYLVLVDNDCRELEKLKEVIQNGAEKECIQIVNICTGTIENSAKEEECIEQVKQKIIELIEHDEVETANIQLHIVADACLTCEEEYLASIKERNDLSGIKCLEVISDYLKSTNCTFYLSLMSRFFAKQLGAFHRLQEFKNDESNNFLTVIKKPILDNGKIDSGYSIAADYIDILPEKLLSKKHSESFENIMLFKLIGD